MKNHAVSLMINSLEETQTTFMTFLWIQRINYRTQNVCQGVRSQFPSDKSIIYTEKNGCEMLYADMMLWSMFFHL